MAKLNVCDAIVGLGLLARVVVGGVELPATPEEAAATPVGWGVCASIVVNGSDSEYLSELCQSAFPDWPWREDT